VVVVVVVATAAVAAATAIPIRVPLICNKKTNEWCAFMAWVLFYRALFFEFLSYPIFWWGTVMTRNPTRIHWFILNRLEFLNTFVREEWERYEYHLLVVSLYHSQHPILSQNDLLSSDMQFENEHRSEPFWESYLGLHLDKVLHLTHVIMMKQHAFVGYLLFRMAACCLFSLCCHFLAFGVVHFAPTPWFKLACWTFSI